MYSMSKYYQLKVSLIGIQPEIFRTFTLPCNATFFDLHTAIQLACGWGNYHSYLFQNEDEEDLAQHYFTEFNESNDDALDDTIPEDVSLKLSSYFQDGNKVGKCFYLYDFQDYWLHSISLQQIVEDETVFLRKLVDGARCFPPESCGGILGYQELCALKETGKIPDSLDWSDAANIMELLDEWSPDDFNFNRLKAIFDLPAQFQKKSA
jgi:hypothetical protein